MKLCDMCDERGLRYEEHSHGYDTVGVWVPHAFSERVQRDKLRSLRKEYPLGASPGLFLLWWWLSFVFCEGLVIGGANMSPERSGFGDVMALAIFVVPLVWIVAWAWYDWCPICTRRGRAGRHKRCDEIMRRELACYEAMNRKR